MGTEGWAGLVIGFVACFVFMMLLGGYASRQDQRELRRRFGPPAWVKAFRERYPNAKVPVLDTIKIPVLRGARVLPLTGNPGFVRRTRYDDNLPHYVAYEEIPENLNAGPTYHRCGVYLFVGTVEEHVTAFREDLLNQLRAVAKFDTATSHTSEEDVATVLQHWQFVDDRQKSLPEYQLRGAYAVQNRDVCALPHVIRYDRLTRELRGDREPTQVLTAEELQELQTSMRNWTPVPHPVVEPALRRLEFPPE